MKKAIICASFIIILLFSLFSATYPAEYKERTWAYNGEQATTVNLENTFYLPTYDVEWEAYSNNLVNGTYITKPQNNKVPNGIGHFGASSGCEHQITFTVYSDGRFTSQSDPTKYRDYYVALKPRIREYTGPKISDGKDLNYFVNAKTGAVAALTDRVPNTRESNTISVTSPAMINLYDLSAGAIVLTEDKLVNSGPKKGLIYPARVYWDVLLGLDPITSQDKIHLADLDDYIARVYITWACEDSNCTNPEHFGSFVFTIRGLYNSSGNESDNVFMIVNPEAAASRLDILGMLDANTGIGRERIATMNVLTTNPNNNPKWDTHVMVFLSASPNYNTQNPEGFKLKRYFPSVNSSTDIPFVIRVYNEGFEGVTENRHYTGTEYYRSYQQDKNMCLNFIGKRIDDSGNEYDIIQTYNERTGKSSSGLIFNGSVYLEIDDSAGTIRNHPENYAGIYIANIYYHIVYAN